MKIGKGMIISGLAGIGLYLLGAKAGDEYAVQRISKGLERMFEGDLSSGHERNPDGSLTFHMGGIEGAGKACNMKHDPKLTFTYSKEDADEKFGSEFGY